MGQKHIVIWSCKPTISIYPESYISLLRLPHPIREQLHIEYKKDRQFIIYNRTRLEANKMSDLTLENYKQVTETLVRVTL